jgi:hypothetical protein
MVGHEQIPKTKNPLGGRHGGFRVPRPVSPGWSDLALAVFIKRRKLWLKSARELC